MAFNAKTFNSALSLFCSLFQDMNAADLPEGLSPDNQDVVFLPGSVATRPALQAIGGLGNNSEIMSVVDYPIDNGNRKMMYLDNLGNLFQEDLTSGARTIQTSGSAGIQFKAESAFGKQWYAFFYQTLAAAFSSNPFVGVDVPQYFDGSVFWRVTQDPPGASPVFANLGTNPVALAQTANLGSVTVNSVLGGGQQTIIIGPRKPPDGSTGGISPTVDDSNVAITVTTWTTLVYTCSGAVPASWLNQLISITGLAGANASAANIQGVVAAVNGNTFTINVTYDFQVNLGGQAGTAALPGNFFNRASNIVTVYLGANQPPVFSAGLYTQIANAEGTPINGTNWAITSITRDANGLVTIVISTQLTNLAPGTVLYIAVADATNFPAGSQTVYQVLSEANGSTTFTVQWLGPVATSNAGSVYQVWNGTFQIQTIAQDANNNWYIQYFQLGPDTTLSATGGTPQAQIQSQMPPGPRNCVCIFKSSNGAITGPSVPVQINVSGGTNLLQATSIPIGPSGTSQRILAFTLAFGTSYFYLKPSKIPSINGLPPVLSLGTIIPDNVTTSAIIDFSDAQLLGGNLPIDQVGNNLFNQIVLAPCLGVIEYTNRLAWWGEINNIKNLLNMGFDGGYVATPQQFATPLGWNSTGSTGGTSGVTSAVLVGGSGVSYQNQGFLCLMISAGGAKDALISQPAYQDYYGAPILQPNASYIFRLLLSGGAAGLTVEPGGQLVAEVFSPSQGLLSSSTISMTGTGVIKQAWFTAAFNNPMPASIPTDTVFRVYMRSSTNGAQISLDEMLLIDANQPVLSKQARISYASNPFGYDNQTGKVGFSTNDSLVGAFKQRGYLYFLTDKGLLLTSNNGQTEPYLWQTNLVASECGCCSPCAVDTYEDVALWAGRHGHRMFSGSTPKKLSQEIEVIWNTINWNVQLNVWLANDPINRLFYVGLPTGSASTPNRVIPVSYRSVDTAYNVPDPLHVSYSGKMICSDLARKSTRWNVTANCGAMVVRSSANGNTQQMIFGGGNGLAPGVGSGFGHLYKLNPLKYTDDDYGVIASYYVTYAHWNHDMEQNVPQLGLHRKIYKYLSAFVTGVGKVQITPLADSLSNPWPASLQYALGLNLTHDLEWKLNVLGDRVFFKVAATPLPGTTDAYFNLQHMVVSGEMDKVFPVRGAVL